MTAAVLAFFGIPTLVALAICADSKRRDSEPDRAEIVCAFCGQRVLIVPVDVRGVPIVHGVTLVDQLGAHDRECLGRSA